MPIFVLGINHTVWKMISDSYTYDLSGNPQKIYFTNGSITKYVYSATGQKLRMVHYTAKANISRAIGQQVELKASEIQSTDSTDYLLGGSLVVRNGKIDKYLFDGGYAQATASGTTDKFTFYYQNKDHLGTVRETVTSSGAMKQRVNYYPFGGQLVDTLKAMVLSPNFQQYKYNGKEFDGTFGLNTYDYGARQHDPILARWDRLDPLCEKYYGVSPYAYCLNNPVKYIDIKGLYPKGVLTFHKASFYRADYYTFTKPAAHLLSLVTGVKEEYIRDVNIMERGFGREYPWYSPNKGGGGITIGSAPNNVTMTFTENYFADKKADYNGNGYGQDVSEWLLMASHEVTHIKHIEQAEGKLQYLLHFVSQYMRYGSHDDVPEEKEANANGDRFLEFNRFLNTNYGKNCLQDLLNSNMSNMQKVQQIDEWWKLYEEQKKRNEQTQ
ncbi:RHS repeat domain-containing protein [Prevotella sp. lc2012]|uniref:RHS repeat domain-containing protein n=1 Tax=Prevotella sp. lc2012 TaxID=1761886 RepID=UPI0015A1B9D3|nr:RHS repeat-associated core domain-containing protein [Prevotella sp. lc2012]